LNLVKKILKILPVLLLVLIFVTQNIFSYAGEIDKAKQDKAALEQKKAETEAKIKQLEKEKSNILEYVEKLDMELSKLSDEIDTVNNKIKAGEEGLKVIEEDLAAAKKKEQDQYSIMKSRIKYMYENGDTSVLETVLQSDDFADMLNQIEYKEKITEYDNGLLENYKRLKKEVAQKESEQKDLLEDLNTLKDTLTFEQNTTEKLATQKMRKSLNISKASLIQRMLLMNIQIR
jgi:Uncharacterized protein conserved in bacteria